MGNSFDANAFTSNFITGFSFVDQIKSRNRAEARLESRLEEQKNERAFQRRRTIEADRQVAENRGFALEDRAFDQADRDRSAEDRQRRLTLERRGKEASVLLSDINTPLEELQEYADFDAVRARMVEVQKNARRQADFEAINQPGGQEQEQNAQEQEQAPGFEAQFPEAAPPPQGAAAPSRRLSNAEINALATEDPAQARAIRDDQQADVSMEDRVALANAGLPPEAAVGTNAAAREKKIQKRGKQDAANSLWGAYGNFSDPVGDPVREAEPTAQVSLYWEDRGNITDLDVRAAADAQVKPAITTTIESQIDALARAEPKSKEHRNATRKLQQAFGLADAMEMDYSPSLAVGVKGGLPLDNRNPALTESVLGASDQPGGTPIPRGSSPQRVDETVVSRTTTARRVPRRKLDAAYRLLNEGKISQASYNSIVTTGNLPSGIQTSVVQRDPKKPTWLVHKDGSGNFLGQRLLDNGTGRAGRNVISDDALSHVQGIAKAYDSAGGGTFGTDTIQTFLTVLEFNATTGAERGYDFSNIQDVANLYQRFMDIYVLRDAYNAEWRYNGEWDPEFSQEIGTLNEALFSPKVDAAAASGQFEVESGPREGDTISSITPLKPLAARLTPQQIQKIRDGAPEFAEASEEEIQAAYDAEIGGQ